MTVSPPRAGLAGATRAITGRGRVFIALGITCLVSAQIIGERDLLRVGALLIVLPFAALAVIARTRYRMRLVRELTPVRAEAGSPVRVRLRLENVSRFPSAVLLVEDTLPADLGSAPRFVLRQVEPGGAREATYTVRAQGRGRFDIGPLTVRLTDPFGCVELRRAFTAVEQLTVTPAVEVLPPAFVGGAGYAGGEGRAARAALIGDADIATREYRQGDDLRKVHWRSTAKVGQLMVRRDEQPRQNQATVILDTRATAHRGSGRLPADSSFEWAVAACASVAVWLCRRDYLVHLVTSAGLRAGGTTPQVAQNDILDLLAVLTVSRESGFETAARAVAASGQAQGGGPTVAVLALGARGPAVHLRSLYPSGGSGLAVALEADSWSTTRRGPANSPGALSGPARELLHAGWTVLPAYRDSRLADLWGGASTAAAGPEAPVTAGTASGPGGEAAR